MPKISSEIEKEILSILSEDADKTLLSFGSGLMIDAHLLLHPSPKTIIKTIVNQRRVEDLIFLSFIVSDAAVQLRSQYPNITQEYLITKSESIFEMTREYNPMFDKFMKEFPKIEENWSEINLTIHRYHEATSKKGLDSSEYLASHRDMLSLGVDYYLLSAVSILLDTSHDNNKKQVDTFWLIRTVLAEYRERFNY